MEETKRLQKVYQLFTESPAEKVPANRLVDILRFAGYIVSESYADELASSIAGDMLDFRQLTDICERIREREVTRDELQKSFRKLDPECTSYIDTGKLVQILSSGENKLNQEEIVELLNILNPDGDGKICYELIIKSIFGY
ncbi:Ca2+-binding protein [Ordospora colligata]|uniref:Ca2+-binding protein n=1 Tax=Ordospora colligata OC4 TaxID=1354746 RepID=A0A0B2ULW7_9MICR|nr:Ca2+-binding protein [Ordospora colligata OC4]KHN70318.1 Ca2+-binding protein [Ordospora colligata OC4]TBU16862.1 Ca2+-binding protein [Ordospora colligata]TBU16970.1 Ca2+-binding protein [Ordospora colligata]TBU19411.1 Ca2+-binding protein [Ordospora colligata]